MDGKTKIWVHRIIWAILLIVVIIITATIEYGIYLLIADILVGGFFIITLTLSCKTYNYNGQEIIVYVGWWHHYIKVDGNVLDEHNTIIGFTPIYLSCTLDDGAVADVTITTFNMSTLKINNRLYKKFKK